MLFIFILKGFINGAEHLRIKYAIQVRYKPVPGINMNKEGI
jgi:hypothetical protein